MKVNNTIYIVKNMKEFNSCVKLLSKHYPNNFSRPNDSNWKYGVSVFVDKSVVSFCNICKDCSYSVNCYKYSQIKHKTTIEYSKSQRELKLKRICNDSIL